MNLSSKKVSIIVRTHNEERWIAHCLGAIFNQDFDGFEVILVDNKLLGRDNENALEPKEFSEMVSNIHQASSSLIDLGNNYLDIESDTVNNYRGRWEPYDYE